MIRRVATLLLGAALAASPMIAEAATSLTVQTANPSGAPITRTRVLIDPDIHHGSLGTVVVDQAGAFKGPITLPDGVHKIATVGYATTSLGTNTSVIVFNQGATCPMDGWRSLSFQSWWSDPGQDPTFESRHAHINGLCVPVNNLPVDGPQTFSMGIELHNQPPGARFTRFRVTDCKPGGSCGDIPGTVITSGLPQPDASGNLIWAHSVTIDLTPMTTGRHEFRFGVYVTQPNGKVQLLSTRVEIAVRSKSPSYRSLTSYPYLQGNGAWYDKDGTPGYADARIVGPLP